MARWVQVRGFTLAEVLVTVAVLAIVLPVALAGVSQATRLAGLTEQRAQALDLAQGKLDELLVDNSWQTGVSAGDFGADHPGYRWQAQVNAWDEANIDEVDVIVGWTSFGRPEKVQLSTLVYTTPGGASTQ